MGDKIFIPFTEDGFENGGQAYGERTLRSGRDTFNERGGATAAFVLQYTNRNPCPRCGRPLLRGQYGRFHRDYGDELVHDGCSDYEAAHEHRDRKYRVSGARKPKLCPDCHMEHNGECP
ncbi:hypothetical protein HWB99_gp105 [Mycobacterium phage DrLupo]|uniref:Uncharacterized protein n=1 Tax=Mycobacterium phage DrLupo TaxID=2499037 RepID=A0A3S9UQU0_9CAUD|nr:hypothetical protein HWB99_gp105 [Mycobacterium phage DrLupo]AZS12641.1 hypothetical protein SEA_DRLUPO_105 [Mycobacterium phage DrLupo]